MNVAVTTLKVLSTLALSLQSQPREADNGAGAAPPSREGTGIEESNGFSRIDQLAVPALPPKHLRRPVAWDGKAY